jgi:hypothetical protein
METLSASTIIFICLFSLAFAVFLIAAQWKIFKKADQPGWASIIPIYNTLVQLRIIGKPWWWLLLMLIPFVNIVFAIWMTNLLSKSFGKDVGFTLGLIFLSFIFYPVLGFGGARYLGPYGDPQKFQEYQQAHKFDFEQ